MTTTTVEVPEDKKPPSKKDVALKTVLVEDLEEETKVPSVTPEVSVESATATTTTKSKDTKPAASATKPVPLTTEAEGMRTPPKVPKPPQKSKGVVPSKSAMKSKTESKPKESVTFVQKLTGQQQQREAI